VDSLPDQRLSLDFRSLIWKYPDTTVYGDAAILRFAKKHAESRKPLSRFLAVARKAAWPHFVALKQSFPATDYAPATGMLVFDIGGNKYRLIATVDFTEQLLHIRRVLTHEEYSREDL
jgi:mRNA interferase HigB